MTTPTNSDIAAIEAALAAGPTQGEWLYSSMDEWSHTVVTHHGNLPDGSPNKWAVAEVNKNREPEHVANARLIAAAHPARLRRVLDTMQAMGEALKELIDLNRGTARDQYGDANKAEAWACVRICRAALALYEGKK